MVINNQQEEVPRSRTCAATEGHLALLEISEEYRRARVEIDRFTLEYLATREKLTPGLRTGIVIIPVVVHVVYNTSSQNISNAQIQSQINILNQDFRALNSDITGVPTAFQPVIADTRIEFRLAVRDPNCQPTTGITRTSTSVTSFTYNPNATTGTARSPVKFASTGGVNAWPRDKYLNIWVCNLSGTLLGYGSFPGGPANEDGVVITYTAFGNTGTAASPFNLGRTATHEVGHWLNLYHIWGNSPTNNCTDTDEVADTPNQFGPNYSCPTHPSPSCGNSGDMFMNYMDYVDDRCMIMFTAGQGTRAEAALFGPRNAILASDALVPPPATTAIDLWMQDTAEDIGNEPNTQSGVMWISNDIWVRNTNDGLTQQEHQNPVYRSSGDRRNYVYVRVRGGGCTGSTSGTLKLYWAKASTALSWPAPWDGSITTPALMGGTIGSKPTGSVSAGSFTILEFPWEPPNPADYASFGADRSHFCLLARLETSATAPFGMTFPEGSNLNNNVRNNNNIVWKNITVTEAGPSGSREAYVTVGNMDEKEKYIRLVFELWREEGVRQLLDWGLVRISLGEKLFERWRRGGSSGEGIEPLQNGFMIVDPRAWIGNIFVEPGELHTIQATFEKRDDYPERTEIFFLDVTQYETIEKEFIEQGGQRFVVKTIGETAPIVTKPGCSPLTYLQRILGIRTPTST